VPTPSDNTQSPVTNGVAVALAQVQAERDATAAERDEYRRLYLLALERVKLLERGIFAYGRERVAPVEQLSIAMLETLGKIQPEPPPPPGSDDAKKPRPKPTGRKPLPEKLPRVDVELLPPEVEKAGTDAFEKIGEDVTETVERRPASLVVVRVHRPKYVPKGQGRGDETKVAQAEVPELPIERGLAGPAMLADTVVRRFADHLPLHRLERVYARDGLELARSTVCGWHMELSLRLRLLIAAMWLDALDSPYLCTDATGVLVQDLEKCRRAHFFVVIAPERHVLFGYSPKHDSAAVDALLEGYEGYLVADASSVYDHLYESGKVVECGCWAHARRYFFKALDSEPERARAALSLIGKLFALERTFKALSPEQRRAARLEHSKPVVEAFFAWCAFESTRTVDESPLSKAIGYATNQREALERFFEDGRLPIHNNWSERELRREAVGRKNWLFVGSDEGGDVNATFVSLIASCQLHGIEPHAYLRDLFCLFPSWPANRVLELAPANWTATAAREDVRKALEANVFRRASLA
jgi:transposase